jgi:hypothetical protein
MSEQKSSDIGYFFNPGGLNNQKLTLLGLFLVALENKLALVLPAMGVKDLVAKTDTPVPLSDVFDISLLKSVASRHGISLSSKDPDSFQTSGWEYFFQGAGRCGYEALNPTRPDAFTPMALDFLTNLVPVKRLTDLAKSLGDEIFGRLGVCLAAQYRIESDWETYSAGTLKPTSNGPEDYLISFDCITAKIANTFAGIKHVLVICDEPAVAIPKAEMREVCQSLYGIRLLWKSDFLNDDQWRALTPLDLSIIDFELGLRAQTFVGISRSTFSNMVTFQKYVANPQQIRNDYIYNNNRMLLDRRTDNGGHTDWQRVIA